MTIKKINRIKTIDVEVLFFYYHKSLTSFVTKVILKTCIGTSHVERKGEFYSHYCKDSLVN